MRLVLAATAEPDLDTLRRRLAADAARAATIIGERLARPMTLPIVFHPDYQAPLRPGHPFPMSKYGYLRAALVARGLHAGARAASSSPAPLPPARAAAVHALGLCRAGGGRPR